MTYYVKLNSEHNGIYCTTNSRDSKKIVRDTGAGSAIIYNKSGRVVSAAARDANDKIFNTFYPTNDSREFRELWAEQLEIFLAATV